MRTTLMALAAVLAAAPATPAAAQRGQMQPPPDHWLTWDSLITGLALSDAQLLDVGAHYEALNAVMKAAAEERAKMREAMGGMGAGGGPPSEAMRQRMQAMRAKMDSLQTDVDRHYQAIRNTLTAEQQAKFDALPKPVVMMQRRGMRRRLAQPTGIQ